MLTTADTPNDAAKNSTQAIAQQNTSPGQRSGVKLASTAQDSMDVDRRQKRGNEQPTSKSITSSPVNPKEAPSQRTEGAPKPLASKNLMGALGVNLVSESEDDVPLSEKYIVVVRGRGRANGQDSRSATRPSTSSSPASWRQAPAGASGATQMGVRQ